MVDKSKYKRISVNIMLVMAVTVLILLMPLMIRQLQAANRQPDHIVTYKAGKLIWDDGTAVDASGSAELTLFKALYPASDKAVVKSADGKPVIAPGTSGNCLVRLVNGDSKAMRYSLKSDKALGNVPMTLSFNEMAELNETDTLRAGASKDVLIAWDWPFYVSDEQDVVDTRIGNQGGEVRASLLINAEDLPAVNTGISGSNALPLIGITIALAAVLAGVLICRQKKQTRRKSNDEKSEIVVFIRSLYGAFDRCGIERECQRKIHHHRRRQRKGACRKVGCKG